MPRGIKKENLPSKICVVCKRPFTWRKKWERVWDEVTTCSKSCNRERKKNDTRCMTGSEIPGSKHSGTIDTASPSEKCEKSVEIRTENVMVSLEGLEDVTFDDEAAFDLEKEMNDSYLRIETSLGDHNEILKAERRARKKAAKAQRRANLEGRGDPSAGQKPCDMCSKSVNLLVRCTYTEKRDWKMICGACWKVASGGIVDGDADHPYYRYGGLWKNRRAQK